MNFQNVFTKQNLKEFTISRWSIVFVAKFVQKLFKKQMWQNKKNTLYYM